MEKQLGAGIGANCGGGARVDLSHPAVLSVAHPIFERNVIHIKGLTDDWYHIAI